MFVPQIDVLAQGLSFLPLRDRLGHIESDGGFRRDILFRDLQGEIVDVHAPIWLKLSQSKVRDSVVRTSSGLCAEMRVSGNIPL